MGLLDDLTNGGQPRDEYQDFVGPYDQGAPYDGISPEEAQSRHDQLAQQLSPDDYGQAAQSAFGDLSPDQRTEIGQQLADHAQRQGIEGDQIGNAQQGDPTSMGALAGMLHGQSPGALGQLLGGGQAGTGALAGIVANAARRFL